MKKQFVTYEIALKLKELGFDEECMAYYKDKKMSGVNKWNREDFEFHSINIKDVTNTTSEIVLAPLWQQVIDWFREKYNIHTNIISWSDAAIINLDGIVLDTYQISVFKNSDKNPIKYIEVYYDDYYKAREQAILKAIELVKISN